jgi:hypothetical protein
MSKKLSPEVLKSIAKVSEILTSLEEALMEFCQLTGRSEDDAIDMIADGIRTKLRMNKDNMQ